jgi:hypothetical protein
MMQLFLKTTKFVETDWDNSYNRILKIVNQFPLKLERIESYDGFSKNIDKIHYDLIVNRNNHEEYVSFWSDQMSYTAGSSVKFYKNWEIQKKIGFTDSEKDTTKPIIWYMPEVFNFSGYLPEANGAKLFPDYLDTRALYRYAVLAIGIMLENNLPGRAFLIALETTIEEVNHTIKWLEYIFNETIDMPLYFDKMQLLENIKEHYDDKVDLVGRMDMLYIKQFKNNMEFALQQIGYKPTLDYYARVLAYAHWGTFGFSDIFSPWIAATKDLEKALELLTHSKKILLSDPKNEHNVKKAEKYDYTEILKDLLNQYILWTPTQREFLDKFYTNKQVLETGSEDLFGTLMRIGGFRIEICPIYANPEHLFEVFMYHDPKNGNKFLTIIDDWLKTNKNKYSEIVNSFSEIENKAQKDIDKKSEQEQTQGIETLKLMGRIEKYSEKYAAPERFFVKEALKKNSYYLDKGNVIDELQLELYKSCRMNKKDIDFQHKKSQGEKLDIIKYWVKKKQLSVFPEFSDWLIEETDDGVLTSLCILVSLKLYESRQSYARQQILLNRKYWQVWEKGGKYSLIELFEKK